MKKSLLSALRSQHDMELELVELEDKIDFIEEEYGRLQDESRKVQNGIDDLRNTLHENTSKIYAPHRVELNLFSSKINGKLSQMEEFQRKREVRLCELSVKAEMSRERATVLQCDLTHLLSEINDMKNIEEQGDEQSAALSLQLKATMAKVNYLNYIIFVQQCILYHILFTCIHLRDHLLDKH